MTTIEIIDAFFKYGVPIMSFFAVVCGYFYAAGKLKEQMLTKDEFRQNCQINQQQCSFGVVKKMDELKRFVEELKVLVVDLHKEQTIKIEQMDNKREDAKAESSKEMIMMNKAIGRIEGYLRSIDIMDSRRMI